MTRYTVHFAGRVQGVGFRYTTMRVARDFDVAGAVRNLDDGRVELIAEGQPAQLDRLVEAILNAMAGYVRDHTVDSAAPTGEFAPGITLRH